MNNVIPFPQYRRVNPRRAIRSKEYSARIVADFGTSMIQATERRRKFHEIMQNVDVFGSLPNINISDRESIQAMLLYATTEELKNQRYRLNLDVIRAVSYMIQLAVNELKEGSPGVFIAPELDEVGKKGGIFGELAILSYVFSRQHRSHPDMLHIKNQVYETYLELADDVWKTIGREGEDAEYMYEELAHIFPLIIDVIKAYMIPFRGHAVQQIGGVERADTGQGNLF